MLRGPLKDVGEERMSPVTEDFSHYTRDPEQPLQQQRLMLVINEKRPPIIY